MRIRAFHLLACLTAPVAAQEPGPVAFERLTLPNGLEVLLAPDPSTQVVGVNLWVLAGSRYDPPSRGGLAHLFTRLGFAGSTHITRGEYGRLVERAHGAFGAEVGEDVARFSVTLPAERLNLGLWLEAERLRGVKLDDSVVALARAAELESQAQDADREAFAEPILTAVTALYDSAACWPYAHRTQGTRTSLEAVTGADAQEFFRRHYVPRNARLVIAGGFNLAEAKRLVTGYFGEIPSGEPVPPPSCDTAAPKAARQVRASAARSDVAAAGQFYRIPGHGHADVPALELLGIVFGQGRSARLSVTLGDSSRAAIATQAGSFATRREAGVFALFAAGRPGVPADSLAGLLATQATWAQGSGLTQADLDRARTIQRATTVSARQRAHDVAEALQHAAAFHGGAEAVNTDPARFAAVTLDDLRRVARLYLTPANAVTLLVTPGGSS